MAATRRLATERAGESEAARRPRPAETAAVVSSLRGWGWLPMLALVEASGLCLVTLAYTAARQGARHAPSVFFLGLLVLFAPVAIRLLSGKASRRESIGLTVLLGLSLYMVKVLKDPLSFQPHDEFSHWRTVNDIVRSGYLFSPNPLQPVAALYPGLAGLTDAVTTLSGLSIFASGIVALGVARVVLVTALYLFYEELSGSTWIAGLASLLYMTNPSFLFFDAHFAYESLALPLAALVLLAAQRRAHAQSSEGRVGLTLVMVAGMGAVVLTHHLTSYALVALLGLWALIMPALHLAKRGLGWRAGRVDSRCGPRAGVASLAPLLSRPNGRDRSGGARWLPGGMACLGLVMTAIWLIYVARRTVGYLSSNLGGGIGELTSLMLREESGRQLFHSYMGQMSPLWERMAGFAAVELILIGLPCGVVLVWRHHRRDALALALAVAALAYPASLPLRFTHRGAEASARSAEFLFVAIGFVLAVAVVALLRAHPPGWRRMALLGTVVTAIFIGGVVVGLPPWARLPGPYLVSADSRSIEPQGIDASLWARDHLGRGHRIATDRINRLLMGTFGEQYPVTGFADGVDTPSLFFSSTLGDVEVATLRSSKIRYIVVDRRLSGSLPVLGVYFEEGEPGTFQRSRPIDPAALAKFDQIEKMGRVFDSGDIAIYDVRGLTDAP